MGEQQSMLAKEANSGCLDREAESSNTHWACESTAMVPSNCFILKVWDSILIYPLVNIEKQNAL